MAKVQTRRSISFNAELHARALKASENGGISLSKYAEAALEEYMARQPAPRGVMRVEDRAGVLHPPIAADGRFAGVLFPPVVIHPLSDHDGDGQCAACGPVDATAPDDPVVNEVRVDYDEAQGDPW